MANIAYLARTHASLTHGNTLRVPIGFELLVTDLDDKALGGTRVRVTQDGALIEEIDLDEEGKAWITGYEPGKPCDVEVVDRCAMGIYGHLPDDGGDGAEFPTYDPGKISNRNDGGCGWDPGILSPASTSESYTIQRGDTLGGIASRYGLSWQELYDYTGDTDAPNSSRLRSGDPNLIYPGEVILVPSE